MEEDAIFLYNSINNKLASITTDLNKVTQWVLNIIKSKSTITNCLKKEYDIIKNEMNVLEMFLDIQLILDTFIRNNISSEENDAIIKQLNACNSGIVSTTTQNLPVETLKNDAAIEIKQEPQKDCISIEKTEENDIKTVLQIESLNISDVQQQSIDLENPSKETAAVDESVSFSKFCNKEMSVVDDSVSFSRPDGIVTNRSNFYELEENEIVSLDAMCTFCHIESPSEFYIHLHHELMEKILGDLNKEVSKNTSPRIKFNSKLEAKDNIGRHCYAYISGRLTWYRVEILDWMLDDPDKILLQLVDFGNNELCSYKKLKPMNYLYSKLPKLAVRCHLAAVFTPASIIKSDKSMEWSNDTIQDFIELSGIKNKAGKPKKFKIIFVQKEGNSFGINLHSEETDENNTIIHKLINKKLVKVHENNDLCGTATAAIDKTVVYIETFNKLALPAVGVEISIVMTSFINPCHYFIQILDENSTNTSTLCSLLNALNSDATVKSLVTYKTMPQDGEIVIFFHWTNKWLRGKVVSKRECFLDIYCVDFGDTSTVILNNVKKIPQQFLYTPFQAVECKLNNYYPNPYLNTKSFSKFFKSYMIFRPFKSIVRKKTCFLWLDIHDAQGLNVGGILKDFNFVFGNNNNSIVPVEEIISSNDDM